MQQKAAKKQSTTLSEDKKLARKDFLPVANFFPAIFLSTIIFTDKFSYRHFIKKTRKFSTF